MTLDGILDAFASFALLLGAGLSFSAGVGLIRFPDVPSRLHAATKPQVLGVLLVVVAIALELRSWTALLALLPVALFQMLTAPISAHMVGRAGYRTGNVEPKSLVVDELHSAVEKATREDDPADP